jgi:hypothetical protein
MKASSTSSVATANSSRVNGRSSIVSVTGPLYRVPASGAT